MNQTIERIGVALLTAVAGFMAAGPVQAADLNIADSPLFVATNVEPNVMFTLDDSGSMQWEHMPDGGGMDFTLYVFPRPENLYGGEVYANQVPNFDNDNFHNFFGRSSHNNGVFYNPMVTYRPWSNPDGSQMPQADPTQAFFNPDRPGVGYLDLTVQNTQTATWFSGTGPNNAVCDPGCGAQHSYWPITFFRYKGSGDPQQASSYDRYQVRNGTAFVRDMASGLENPIASFTWTDGEQTIVRSVEEEVQNFANWFQYHRSRILTSRGAIGRAFTEMPDQARVGFGAINQGESEVDGVSTPTIITGVSAFDLTGRDQFYDRLYNHVLNRSGTPLRTAAENVGEYFERTDDQGPWSTTPGEAGGEDLACRQSFHILMSDGFWNGPNTSLGNVDGTSGPTITGPDVGQGPQSFTYTAESPFSDEHSDTLGDVAMHYWKRDLRPDIANRVSTTAEDPAFWQHLASFGIGLGVEGNLKPDEVFEALDTGADVSWPDPGQTDSNGDVVDRDNPGAAIDDLLHFGLNGHGGFFTARDPESFATELGNLLTEIVSRTAATTGLSASSTRLTQGSRIFAAEFDSEDWTGELKAIDIENGNTLWQAAPQISPSGREVITSQEDGTGEQNFTATGLNPVTKARIDADPQTANDIIRYVRGESVAGFRVRNSLLGDIVNSRPVFVGESNEGWARLPGSAGDSYPGFVDSKKSKTDAVYVGANDGMLHAFNAENGDELFGFVPRAVMGKLGELTKDPYDHKFFVDGQVVVRDVWNGASWRRVLVGGLGAGGRGVFAIDVTNPGNPDVLWELTGGSGPGEIPNLGFTFGDPVITRLGANGSGNWVAIFGNGYNSEDNNAVLFVVDLFSGNIREEIVLEDTSDDNGLSGVAPLLDPNSREFTTRVYAGDLQGTVWRVDFNDSGGASVKADFSDGLFTDPDNRPITSTPGLAASPQGGLFVFVGTGKLIEPDDRLVGNVEMERLYALRDQEDALPNNPKFGEPEITIDNGERVITGEAGEDGWVLNLAETNTPTGERVLARPRIIFGQVIFSTFEPEDDPCAPGGVQRLYVLDALTGAGALDNICENCGVVEVGIGGPIDPPVIIVPPQTTGQGPGENDPTNPFAPGDPDDLPDGTTVGATSGWCSQFGTLNPATGQPLLIGTICDGRQVWRQAQ